jgi:hypothetical protein
MDFNFQTKGTLKISMIPYLQEMIDKFPEDIGKVISTSAAVHLFEEGEDAPKLIDKQAIVFHHVVAKRLWHHGILKKDDIGIKWKNEI